MSSAEERGFRKIDNRVLAELGRIVGVGNLLVGAEEMEPYSHDEVAELRCYPEAVARVETADQAARIMRLAGERRFPVTPRGGGQGLSGGAVPVNGGVVLSLEKMDRILEIDRENLMVSAEPGVITGNLQREVEAEGLFYPPDPASLDSCTIGGNVAEDAGGPRAVKYGVTRHYVCGLDAVLPSGEIVRMGGKIVKNVTGYNLIQLLLGSEGTLAVIVKVLLRLLPLPKARVDLLVPFDDFRGAAVSVSRIIEDRIVPAAMEFMERDSIAAVEKLMEKPVPHSDAAAHLLITLDGSDTGAMEADYERIGEICLENGASDVLVADNEPTREKLWQARRLIIEALQNLSPDRIMDTQDVVVPRTRLPELLVRIKEVGRKHDLRIVSFGHSGDGNVHVNIIKDGPDDVWREKDPAAAEEIYRIAVELDGMVSGEHGIGLTRKKYLSLGLAAPEIEAMRRIKRAFDPVGILNPGKIFP